MPFKDGGNTQDHGTRAPGDHRVVTTRRTSGSTTLASAIERDRHPPHTRGVPNTKGAGNFSPASSAYPNPTAGNVPSDASHPNPVVHGKGRIPFPTGNRNPIALPNRNHERDSPSVGNQQRQQEGKGTAAGMAPPLQATFASAVRKSTTRNGRKSVGERKPTHDGGAREGNEGVGVLNINGTSGSSGASPDAEEGSKGSASQSPHNGPSTTTGGPESQDSNDQSSLGAANSTWNGRADWLGTGDKVELHSFKNAYWLEGLRATVRNVFSETRSGGRRSRVRVQISYDDLSLLNQHRYPMTVPMQNLRPVREA